MVHRVAPHLVLSRSRRCACNSPGTHPPSPKWVMKGFAIYLNWCMCVLQDWASNSNCTGLSTLGFLGILARNSNSKNGSTTDTISCTMYTGTAGMSFNKRHTHFKMQFQLASYLHKGLPVPVWKVVILCDEIPLNCCGAFYQLLLPTVLTLHFHPCLKW